MEMIEIDSLSAEGNTSLDTKLQYSKNCGNEVHQLANKDMPLQDTIDKETIKHSYTKTLCRTALLISVILIVIGVMQIPITLYSTAAPSSDGMTDILFDLVDFESCLINVETYEMMSYDMIVGVCQSEMNNSIETLSSCSDVQASAVSALACIYNLGVTLDSRLCVEDGLSFFCNSIAVLCGNVNGSSMLTEQCAEICDSDCAIEWKIIGSLLPNVSIPGCSSFDDGANLTFSAVPPPQTCPNNFDVFCDTFCLPVCGEVSPYSDSITNFYNVWSILLFVISVTGGIVAFITFYLKRETIFKYPVVFIVYGAILIPFIDIFVILPYIIGPNLLCSTDNVVIAMQESTVFCEIQGLVTHGGISTFCLLMLFHILHLFSSVAFPFKSKQLWQSKSFKRKAYVIEIILILICGLLPSIIILSVSGYQFRGFPLACVSRSEPVPVYIFLVSNAVVGVSSLSLLLVTFWIIHKNAKQDSEKKAYKGTILFSIKSLLSSFSVAEIKLLILLCYYWVTIVILLTNVSLGIGGSDKVMKRLISCTANGIECETIREVLREDTGDDDLVLICFAHTLRALIQWVNLVFVIQTSDIKAVYKRIVDFSFKTQ